MAFRNVGTYYILASASVFYGCITPYDFEVNNSEKVLVIEGGLNNIPKPHQVSLKYSYSLDSGSISEPVLDAHVFIIDQEGNKEPFYHEINGTYISQENFHGESGKSYKIRIEISDNTYESEFEEMPQAQTIDEVFGRVVSILDQESNALEKGVQFFINSNGTGDQVNYYRFSYEDTYQIDVPFPSNWEVKEGSSLEYRQKRIGTCYAYNSSTELITTSTINNASNTLVEFPYRFISEKSQLLRTRLSMLTRQYSITENAYRFYKKLEENKSKLGSLADIQLGTVRGNVTSQKNKNELVLGFFEVSALTERRDFFTPYEFEGYPRPSFLFNCTLPDPLELDSAISIVKSNPRYQIFDLNLPQAYILDITCTSCDWYADLTPPDYWTNE